MTSKICDLENDTTKPKGLFSALCKLYGQDLKCRPEDLVEAAWKAVPKYEKWTKENEEVAER